MLLRSSSTPILNSRIQPHCNHSNSNSSKDSSPDNINHHELSFSILPRTNSISSLTSSSPDHHYSKPATRTLSDTDHSDQPLAKTTSTPLQRLFSSSGLDEVLMEEETVSRRGEYILEFMTAGGGGEDSGGDSGRVCGGGGGGMDSGDGRGGGSGFYEYGNNSSSNDHGHGSMEAYYQKMIEANSRNPLILGNYAKFLKEVRGDLTKAEEFCGRAILASPRDANMLSLYADIIWQTQRDAQRAESYFDQAVKAAPDDCYVLASYAKFLWDMEEEEEPQDNTDGSSLSQPQYWEDQTPNVLS